jgi:hypothetical protein
VEKEAETQSHQEARRTRGRGVVGEEKRPSPRDVEREIAGEPASEFWFALGLVLVDSAQK